MYLYICETWYHYLCSSMKRLRIQYNNAVRIIFECRRYNKQVFANVHGAIHEWIRRPDEIPGYSETRLAVINSLKWCLRSVLFHLIYMFVLYSFTLLYLWIQLSISIIWDVLNCTNLPTSGNKIVFYYYRLSSIRMSVLNVMRQNSEVISVGHMKKKQFFCGFVENKWYIGLHSDVELKIL